MYPGQTVCRIFSISSSDTREAMFSGGPGFLSVLQSFNERLPHIAISIEYQERVF